jgi:Family of unknown function (DUF6263)
MMPSDSMWRRFVMKNALPQWTLILCCGSLIWLAGCSKWGSSEDEVVEEGGVAELVDDPEPRADRSVVQAAASLPQAKPPAPPAGNAAVRTRWPLLKTVEQQLRQESPEGWVNSRSVMELTMLISTDESQGRPSGSPLAEMGERGTIYRVEYQRVRLTQEVPGQSAPTYDSDAAPVAVPPAFRPYQGLKNNGFQFRLSRDLQLAEVIGFEAFLERCLQAAAPEQRALVRSSLPVTTLAEGVSFFVDESLGLIPANVSRAGDNWMRTQETAQPVPFVATTRYTLRQATSEISEIDILGSIVPAGDAASPHGAIADGVQIVIRGGELRGDCRIDRRSGLPMKSHVEQSLDMLVRMADGSEFPQRKTTVTTLQMLPDSSEATSITLTSGVRNQPPGHSSLSPGRPEKGPSLRR